MMNVCLATLQNALIITPVCHPYRLVHAPLSARISSSAVVRTQFAVGRVSTGMW